MLSRIATSRRRAFGPDPGWVGHRPTPSLSARPRARRLGVGEYGAPDRQVGFEAHYAHDIMIAISMFISPGFLGEVYRRRCVGVVLNRDQSFHRRGAWPDGDAASDANDLQKNGLFAASGQMRLGRASEVVRRTGRRRPLQPRRLHRS